MLHVPHKTKKPACFLFASNNIHKFKECKAILPNIPFVFPKEIGIICDVEETGSTFFENAYIKALAFYMALSAVKNVKHHILGILSEDSGLCVQALKNKPHIYSARYGFDGLTTDARPIPPHLKSTMSSDPHFQCKLLQYEIQDKKNKNAYFNCCNVLLNNTKEFISVQTAWNGQISQTEIKGENGFGYDPIFIPVEHSCLSSQLSSTQKNKISHRSKALKILKTNLYAILKSYE